VTLVGLDDTDSRERGMCTTYVAARLAERFRREGEVRRLCLVRLNPAVPYKTRGNAALAVHTDLDPERALALARDHLALAESDDPRTNPGVVVAPGDPTDVSDRVAAFAREAVREHHDIADAVALAEGAGYRTAHGGNGRGRIGALAAVGGWCAFEDWTYECISYRERDRWGTDREVDRDSVFRAATRAYPDAWDTVDRGEGYPDRVSPGHPVRSSTGSGGTTPTSSGRSPPPSRANRSPAGPCSSRTRAPTPTSGGQRPPPASGTGEPTASLARYATLRRPGRVATCSSGWGTTPGQSSVWPSSRPSASGTASGRSGPVTDSPSVARCPTGRSNWRSSPSGSL
jgi:hypothetical protein